MASFTAHTDLFSRANSNRELPLPFARRSPKRTDPNVRTNAIECSARVSFPILNGTYTTCASIGAFVDGARKKHFSLAGGYILFWHVNGCTGKMGKAVAEAAFSAGLQLLPVTFSSLEKSGSVRLGSTDIQIHGPSERERVLSAIFSEYPDVVVVDYTVPDAVNANAELYCKVGVPFVMGTTGGDRKMLYKTVQDANTYSVISPQMGKQVVAFLAAMEIMADQFPGAFAGYSLQYVSKTSILEEMKSPSNIAQQCQHNRALPSTEVMESHQASKVDISGTAKAVISCFQKLGVSLELDQIKQIRDPKKQVKTVGVPEEHLSGHAFHTYRLKSPDDTVSFEFQHNVCGRSIYAEGTIDAAIFLFKRVQAKADKRIYDMIDVLREGNMR